MILRVTFSQPPDRRQNALATRKALLGLAPQPRPGIRARPRTHHGPPERTHSFRMRRQRPRPSPRQASLRPPDPQQSDAEIPARVGAHELRRVMPLAEPNPHTMRELALECPAPRAVETNRADRHLDRDATCLVERGKSRHAASVSDPRTRNCAELRRMRVVFQVALAASAIWPNHSRRRLSRISCEIRSQSGLRRRECRPNAQPAADYRRTPCK